MRKLRFLFIGLCLATSLAFGQVQQSVTTTLTITIVGPLQVTTTALTGGEVGQAYSATLTATGGVPPYTWSVAAGSSLPPGLVLSSAGAISGTPTTPGNYSTTIQVKDSGTSGSAVKPIAATTTK